MNKGLLFLELKGQVDIFVSGGDLVHPAVISAIESCVAADVLQDGYSIRDVLSVVFGFDLDEEFEAIDVEHRTLITNKIVKDIRYSGFERCDAEWIENPMCSKEMKRRAENIILRENGRF